MPSDLFALTCCSDFSAFACFKLFGILTRDLSQSLQQKRSSLKRTVSFASALGEFQFPGAGNGNTGSEDAYSKAQQS